MYVVARRAPSHVDAFEAHPFPESPMLYLQKDGSWKPNRTTAEIYTSGEAERVKKEKEDKEPDYNYSIEKEIPI